MRYYKAGTNQWGRVARLEEQVMGRDGKQDQRVLIRRAHAELDALYPGLGNRDHPHHHTIVAVLLQADHNGGRIPADAPPLGPTIEARVRRDRAVTVPAELPWPVGESGKPPGWQARY